MITHFQIENFKGHRDTNVALERLTVLVGDNGSGKTSVLESLRLPGRIGSKAEDLVLDELLRRGTNHMELSFEGRTHGQRWTTSIGFTAPGHHAWGNVWELKAGGVDVSGQFGESAPSEAYISQTPQMVALHRITGLMGHVGFYRFRSDQVAASSYSDQPGASVAEDGAQTAVALAALELADDDAFNRIEQAMLDRVITRYAARSRHRLGSRRLSRRARHRSPPSTRSEDRGAPTRYVVAASGCMVGPRPCITPEAETTALRRSPLPGVEQRLQDAGLQQVAEARAHEAVASSGI